MINRLALLTLVTMAGALCGAADAEERADRGSSGPPTKPLAVDCARGDTISGALAQHANRTLVVEVSGTCVENVAIRRSDVTLRGVAGAEIVGTVAVESAARIALEALTLRNSSAQGLNIVRASEVTARDLTVRNQPREGIVLSDNSTLTGSNLTLEQNVSHGIRVRGSSHLSLSGQVLARSNGGAGVLIDLGSSLLGGALVLDASNNFAGLVVQGSMAQLQNTQLTASNNSFTGVLIRDRSQLFLGTSQLTIKNNAFSGMTAAMGSNIANFLGATSTALVADNANFGVFVNTSSYFNTAGGLNITITNNAVTGLNADNGNLEIKGVTSTGNGPGGDVAFAFTSRAKSVGVNTLGVTVCDGTETLIALACSPLTAAQSALIEAARERGARAEEAFNGSLGEAFSD